MDYNVEKYESRTAINEYVLKINEQLKNLEKNFDALKAELKEDLKAIDSTNLISEQNKNIALLHKYMSRLAEEKYTNMKIQKVCDAMEAELMDYYKFRWDKSTKLTSTEVMKLVSAHECFVVITKYLYLSEIINDHIENMISVFKDRNYAIKNIIEVRKMELGL